MGPPAASTLSGASPISKTQTTPCSTSSNDDIEQVHSTVEALALTDISTSRSKSEPGAKKVQLDEEYKDGVEAHLNWTESSSPSELVRPKDKKDVEKGDRSEDKEVSRAKSILLNGAEEGHPKITKRYSKKEKKFMITHHYDKSGGEEAQQRDWQEMDPKKQEDFEQGYCKGTQGWVDEDLVKKRDASRQGDWTTERHDPPRGDEYHLDKFRYKNIPSSPKTNYG